MLDFIIKNSMFIMKPGEAVVSAACGGGWTNSMLMKHCGIVFSAACGGGCTSSMFMKHCGIVFSAACGGGQTGMCIHARGNLERACNGGGMD